MRKGEWSGLTMAVLMSASMRTYDDELVYCHDIPPPNLMMSCFATYDFNCISTFSFYTKLVWPLTLLANESLLSLDMSQ
jgi:hypothetical protein